MRALAIIPALAIPVMAAISSCATDAANSQQAAATSARDCPVIEAVVREHYKFDKNNPPLPVREDDGWAPACDFSKDGIALKPWSSGEFVVFQKPVYDSQGAMVRTSLVHGPAAGKGYECRLRSGVAGWTVSECKVAWVS